MPAAEASRPMGVDTALAPPALAIVPPAAAGAHTAVALPGGARPRFSIIWIVAVTAGALITAAVLAVGAVSERNARAALTHEIEARLFLQAHNLALAAGDAMLSDFPELTLHPLAREMARGQKELALVDVVDRNGRVVGDPEPRQLGTTLSLPRSADVATTQPLEKGEHLFRSGALLVASVPVTHRDGRSLGMAFVGMRIDYLDAVLRRARQQQVVVLAVVLLAGFVLATYVMSRLLRPVAALRDGIERIGHGDLNTPVHLHDRTEFGVLADAVNQMASQLKRAQSELVERERLAHELDLAREIQASLLPARGMREGTFEIDGANRAALEVGGDYYDFFRMSDGRVGIAIADVSGKGLAGCMVMSMLSALLRAYRDARFTPAQMLMTLDTQLGQTLQQGSFVTMFYGVLDPANSRLTFASAGHSPLLVYRHATHTVESRRATGIPLGAVRGGAIARTLKDETVDLEPGDALVQFTDGINEAFEPNGVEQFGMDRLERVVSLAAPQGAQAVLDEVHRAVDEWVAGGPALDDETVLVVTRVAADSPAGRDPLEMLAEARARGDRLELPTEHEDLAALDKWLAANAWTRALARGPFEVLRTALHEAAANVVEHGYKNAPSHKFELWCVPAAPEGGAASTTAYFLIRDHGRPFAAGHWRGTDFTDRRVWKRGRGFGLDIIHRGMRDVRYHPETREGNLTVLAFDPHHTEEPSDV